MQRKITRWYPPKSCIMEQFPCLINIVGLLKSILILIIINYVNCASNNEYAKDIILIYDSFVKVQTQLYSIKSNIVKIESDYSTILQEAKIEGIINGYLLSDINQMNTNLRKLQSLIERLHADIAAVQTETERSKSFNYEGLGKLGNHMFDMGKLVLEFGNNTVQIDNHFMEMRNKLGNGVLPDKIRRRIENMAAEVHDIGNRLVDVGTPLSNAGRKVLDIAKRSDNVKEVLKNMGNMLISTGNVTINQGKKIAESASSTLEAGTLAFDPKNSGEKVATNINLTDVNDVKRNSGRFEKSFAVNEMKVIVRKNVNA